MKKILITLLFVVNLFATTSEIYVTEKNAIIIDCIFNGYKRAICENAFAQTEDEISFIYVLDADYWFENNSELISDIEEGLVKPTKDYIFYIDIYDWWEEQFKKNLKEAEEVEK